MLTKNGTEGFQIWKKFYSISWLSCFFSFSYQYHWLVCHFGKKKNVCACVRACVFVRVRDRVKPNCCITHFRWKEDPATLLCHYLHNIFDSRTCCCSQRLLHGAKKSISTAVGPSKLWTVIFHCHNVGTFSLTSESSHFPLGRKDLSVSELCIKSTTHN